MIWYVIIIVLILGVAYVNNHISKEIFYPPLYLSFIWILFLIIHLLYNIFSKYKPFLLSYKTLFYFFLVILLFSFGGLIAKVNIINKSKSEIKIHIPKWTLNLLLVLNISSICFYFLKIKELTGSYFDMLLFRYYTSVERIDIGVLKYSITLAIFSSLLFLIDFFNKDYKNLKSKISLTFILLCSFSLAFLSSSRGTFMFLLISCLGVYSTYNRINVKLIYKVIGVTLIVFIIMATLMKKSMPNEHESNKTYSAIDRVEYFLYSYSSLPLSAFDKFINEPYEISNGDILFRFPKAVLFKTGIVKTPPKQLVERYVKVPDMVNVHTAFYKLIKDLGILYSLIVMFLIGFLHSHFYFNSRKSFSSLIGFSVLLFPLTMTFFEENYISILSTWFQYIILVMITKKIIRIDEKN